MARLTVAEVAEETRRHPVTVRRALEAGELHGSQPKAGARWTVKSECVEPWLEGEKCEHQRTSNVTPLRLPMAVVS